MIGIERPSSAPARLARGTALLAQLELDLFAQPNVAGSATVPFKFDKTIYGHVSVKRALIQMQHSKCAYCEARFAGNASGDVEHFRPKTYSQQDTGAPKLYPGYYWLAYAWANLYYACELCNRSNKKNLFPLHDQGVRARTPMADRILEQPMLIDPATEDPREHIGFRHNKPYAKTPRGEVTIRVMGLDRASLDPDRIEWLNKLELLRLVAGMDEEGVDDDLSQAIVDARAELLTMRASTAKFSAMATDYLDQVL
jgi:uncharacterized protein (TIGR02646 family)